MKNFVLYLDIDGVILPDGYRSPPYYTLNNLRTLLEIGSPLVVLSSDWRYHGIEYVENQFLEWGMILSIWDTTPHSNNYTKKRGEEIAEHRKMFSFPHYLILDDLDEGMKEHTSSFVHCSPREGLTNTKLLEALNKIRLFSV